jgi:hypothetical protein
LIKKIGRGPAALKAILDRAAEMPVIGWVVRRLTSVWLGIIVLALIGVYIAIGSGVPELRAKWEMTDLQFFNAWPMRVLLVLLAADLIVVTLRRIPLTLFKLGSWTVHTGIITLLVGCVIYFGFKQEGAARMYLNKPVKYWYDVTDRALYSFPVKADGTFDVDNPTITPLPTLPIYYEHEHSRGNGLNIQLPGAVAGAEANVVGYLPAAFLTPSQYRAAGAGDESVGPVIGVTLSTARESLPVMWLRGATAASRKFELTQPFMLEFLANPPAERVKELQTSFEGSLAVTVRVPKLNVDTTIPINSKEKFDTDLPIAGTPYTIKIVDGQGALPVPMVSKGYEGLQSSYLSIEVTRKEGDNTVKFERQVIGRYPERSPDWVMENGQRTRKQDRVDNDIQLTFHDATGTNVWIVQTDKPIVEGGKKLFAILRTSDGKSVTLDVDKPIEAPLAGMTGLKVAVTHHFENAAAVMSPQIIPPADRAKGQTVMEIIQQSLIEMEIKTSNGTMKNVYVPFVPYGAVDGPEGVKPTVVDVPGKGRVGLLLSTVRRELPTTATLTDFVAEKAPNSMGFYSNYLSTIRFDDGTEQITRKSELNKPVYDKGLIYFQSQWDGKENAKPEERFSVMGVANRPAMWTMIIGSVLMAVGIGFAFYVKPLLLKWKKESLAKWNAQRAGSSGGATPAAM